MKNFLHHHWTRVEKKLAQFYGRRFVLASLFGILLAGLVALYALLNDESRRLSLHELASVADVNISKSIDSQPSLPPDTKPIGGEFHLVNQDNKPVSNQDFIGKYLLVYFGYTFCPDMCPTGLKSLAIALDKLGKDADKVQPIFITVDPERDTPAKLKEYVANFDPRIVALTGTPEQIAAVAKAYQVYYAKQDREDKDDYMVDHSSLIYLMGPDGRFISLFNEQVDPNQLVKALQDAGATAK